MRRDQGSTVKRLSRAYSWNFIGCSISEYIFSLFHILSHLFAVVGICTQNYVFSAMCVYLLSNWIELTRICFYTIFLSCSIVYLFISL